MSERELDLLDTLLAMVRAEFPQCTEAQADRLDCRIRAVWGGHRGHIAKTKERKRGRPATPDEVLRRAHADVLGNEPTQVITSRHGISRATLYRLMKKGPPGAP